MVIFNFLLLGSATAGILPTARGDSDAERTASAQRGQSLELLPIKLSSWGLNK